MSKWSYVALSVAFAVVVGSCSTTPSNNSSSSVSPTSASSKPAPGSYRIYVTDEISGDLTIIEAPGYNVVSTIKLGKRPRGIHPSPDGQTIYIALSGTPPAPPGVDESTLPPPDKSADGLGVFDVKQNKIVRMIPGGSDPENFDVSHDGKWLYVSNEDASGVSFIDLAQGKLTKTIPTGQEPEGVKLTPDGARIFSTAEEDGTVSAIDASAAKLIKTFKVGRRPRNVVFMPDGTHAYVNAENDGGIVLFDAMKYRVIKPISLGKPGVIKPMGLALSPDASKLYVTTGRGGKLFVVDTATNQPVSSVDVGKRPWGLALSPDGKTIITANGTSNDVSIVDLATLTVTKKVPVPGGPWGVITLKE